MNVKNALNKNVKIISDGGIKFSGDIAKLWLLVQMPL